MTDVVARWPVALVLFASTAGPVLADMQKDNQVKDLRWEELPRVVMGRKVVAVLSDGARLEGKVRRIHPAFLAPDVAQTSNPLAYPKRAEHDPMRTPVHSSGRAAALANRGCAHRAGCRLGPRLDARAADVGRGIDGRLVRLVRGRRDFCGCGLSGRQWR